MQELRKKIDKIDDQLVELFEKRMQISKDVALAKKKINKKITDISREEEILDRLSKKYSANSTDIKSLYQTIFSISKNIQRLENEESDFEKELLSAIKNSKEKIKDRPKVAVQGTRGSYGDISTDKIFSNPLKEYYSSFEEIFKAVDRGECEFGVLPIENSTYGSVNEVYDLMAENKFFIAGEYKLEIKHFLLAKDHTRIEDVKEILSHYQALGQCSNFLKENKNIKIRQYANTALAAEYVSKSDRNDIACIASEACKDIFGLKILKKDIQNNKNNYTRFIIITKKMKLYENANKISIIVEADHKPGALFELIGNFSSLGLNLTKIESRPIVGSDFEFKFYFDFEASIYDKKVRKLLSELNEAKGYFSFLGNYVEF